MNLHRPHRPNGGTARRRPTYGIVAWLAAAICLNLAAQTARAVTLQPGEIIIGANIGASTTNFDWGLLAIDPVTGNRTIIADNTHGSGPAFKGPTAISFAPDGSLLLTFDNNTMSNGALLYRVDPATGNRTIISAGATNTGPSSTYIGAIQEGNTIFMSGGPIVSVDPATGNRTLISGTGQGTGPDVFSVGFAISGANLYVANSNGAILNVDATTGDRTVVSSATVGTGPALNLPTEIVIGAAGNLLVDNAPSLLGAGSSTLLSVDPATGNRTIVSGGGVGTGTDLGGFPTQVAIAANGTIYANQLTFNLSQSPVLAIDPLTGNRTILSDATHGTGPLFDPSTALAIVPAPEPSTPVMAAIAALALIGLGARRFKV